MASMPYRASIVVPVYKTEQFLPHCIESLLDQTQENFEIVVVDDYSPGDCRSIVEKYQSTRAPIKYLRHPRNLGTLCARFTGTEHSIGDYIGYLDADDLARPNFVGLLLATATETRADIIGSLAKEADQRSRFVIQGAEGVLKAYADKTIPNYNVWTKLYSKDLVLSLNDLRLFAKKNPCSNSEDLLFNVFCALKNPTYVNIPEVLVDHNQERQGSATNPMTSDDVRRALRESALAYEYIRDAAIGFERFVEKLIHGSVKYNYRKILNSSKDDLEWATSYFTYSPSGNLVLASMLSAAEEERRKLRKRLHVQRKELNELDVQRQTLVSATKTLAATRKKLKNERKKMQKLRAINESLTARAFFADRLGRIELLKVLRTFFTQKLT